MKIIKIILFAVMLPVAWLIVKYADEYLRPYRKHEMRKP